MQAAAPRQTALTAAAAPRLPTAPTPAIARSSHAPVIDRAEIARIVDRFLASRGQTGAPPSVPAAGSCAVPAPIANLAAIAPRAEIARTESAKPKPVEFVCEDDVRRALTKNEKIFVGPRTIITPAARDLGDAREVFARVS